jgi:hypothetical protein
MSAAHNSGEVTKSGYCMPNDKDKWAMSAYLYPGSDGVVAGEGWGRIRAEFRRYRRSPVQGNPRIGSIEDASMRFLVWAELVEDGEEGSVLDLARGGFHHRRLKSPVRPGFGVGRKSSGGGRNWRPGFVGSFYRALTVDDGRGSLHWRPGRGSPASWHSPAR